MTKRGAKAETALRVLIEGFLAETFERYPQRASSAGLHEYDGRITDFGAEAMDAWHERVRALVAEAAALDETGLEPGDALDLAVLRLAIDHELYYLDDVRAYRQNPMDYVWEIDVSTYVKRSYAPLPERAQALAAHLGEVPRVLAQASVNLERPVPEPFLKMAQDMYKGAVRFLADELMPELEGLDDDMSELRKEVDDARTAAISAVEGFLEVLDGVAAAGETTPEFAIGEEAFRRMLKSGEGVDVDLARLVELGEADLERNRRAFETVAQAIDSDRAPAVIMADLGNDHPEADDLMETTAEMIDDLRQWIADHDVVTVPDTGRLLVEATPAYMRWAFAMMSSPGAFETQADESYYYVTPPEDDWPDERRRQWLTKFAFSRLRDISIHEAYPGHFVHHLHFRAIDSKVRRVFSAASSWEAWAHYCEQMMIELGYRPGDLDLRLAQLAEAILRDVRYLVAIRMHTAGMTIDEAAELFERDAFMSPATARQEALRGAFDPGFLVYTLGKLMLLKLRDDYKREKEAAGEAFSLRSFHDEFLSYGAPPVPLVRRAMLTGGVEDVL